MSILHFFIYLGIFTWLFNSAWRLRNSDLSGRAIRRLLQPQILLVIAVTALSDLLIVRRLSSGWIIHIDELVVGLVPLALLLPRVGSNPKWCTAIGVTPLAILLLRPMAPWERGQGLERIIIFFMVGIFYPLVLIYSNSSAVRRRQQAIAGQAVDWKDQLPIVGLAALAGWGLAVIGVLAALGGPNPIFALVAVMALAPTVCLFPKMGHRPEMVKLCAWLHLIATAAGPLAFTYSMMHL